MQLESFTYSDYVVQQQCVNENVRWWVMSGFNKLLGVVVAMMLALPAATRAESIELVMVEEMGCVWCERWDEEIAPIYPRTTEGKFAPLRRVDIYAIPEDLTVLRRVNFTPTFLIVENGVELARLEGYPGEDFFWPVLARLLYKYTDYKGED